MNGALIIFQCTIFEGWDDILNIAERTVGPYVLLYFIPVVCILGLFLIHLFLAVINSQFIEVHKNLMET
jgi:hypothetical protein